MLLDIDTTLKTLMMISISTRTILDSYELSGEEIGLGGNYFSLWYYRIFYQDFQNSSNFKASQVSRLVGMKSNATNEHFDRFLRVEMDSFTHSIAEAYNFGIFNGSVATNQLSAASLHLSVLQHRNWRASSSVVNHDAWKFARLYLEYWRTSDYAVIWSIIRKK